MAEEMVNKNKLLQEIKELKKEVFDLRFQHGVGKLVDSSKLKKSRVSLARAVTKLNCSEVGKI